jgi:hypothetical protein
MVRGRKGAMAKGPGTLAVIALCVSISGTAFSIFQWWRSQHDAEISTAIEFSKNYTHDIDETTMMAIMTAYIGRQISTQDAIKAVKFSETLEYIAFLANRAKLDKSYLSPSLTCTIIYAEQALANIRKTNPFMSDVAKSEIAEFSHTTRCEEKRRLDEMIRNALPPQTESLPGAIAPLTGNSLPEGR